MKSPVKNRTEYENLLKTQEFILDELKQLKTKVMVLGSLRRFEELAKKGRRFAKDKRIKLSDVLEND